MFKNIIAFLFTICSYSNSIATSCIVSPRFEEIDGQSRTLTVDVKNAGHESSTLNIKILVEEIDDSGNIVWKEIFSNNNESVSGDNRSTFSCKLLEILSAKHFGNKVKAVIETISKDGQRITKEIETTIDDIYNKDKQQAN